MPVNVLVVDDSSTIRAVIAKTLQLAGIATGEIHQAANGLEALALLGAHPIDLVLSDINMPVMSGIEMIHRMNQDAALCAIPVVVVSTDGSTARIEQLRAHGVRACVRKPFTPELLRAIVDDIVGGSHVSHSA